MIQPRLGLFARATLLLACAVLAACTQKAPLRTAGHGHAPALKPSAPIDLSDGPPLEAYDLSKIREPVPKREPRARYGNHSPYTVLGRSYTVMQTHSGYVERGIASWYGRKFHGRLTSTREPYDMLGLTAAHKTLPLPSYARVTNLTSGESLIVRINDRGPFKDNRIIDLSFAAAVKLGVKQTGTALVEVRVIDPGEYPDLGPRAAFEPALKSNARRVTPATLPPSSFAARTDVIAQEPSIFLQVGAFSSRDNAEVQKRRLLSGNIVPAFVDQVATARGPMHRVRVGPLESVALADELTHDIEALGFESPQIVIQ